MENEEKERLLPEEDEESEKSVDEEDDLKKSGEVAAKPAGIWKLFSYATLLDWILMLMGTIAGIVHGAALPVFLVIFGNSFNDFIYQKVTYNLEFLKNGSDLECGVAVNSIFFNETVSEATNKDPDCPYVITATSTLSTIIDVCYQSTSQCLNNDKFIHDINIMVIKTLLFGAAIFVFGTIQVTLFQAACERQVKKIRLAFYKAILSQEIGFFDVNSTGELSSSISDDVDKVHHGMGEKMSLFIQWTTTATGGFIVAFIKEWRLALLLCSFLPLLAISGFSMSKVMTLFASQEQKQYASAGGVAEEILSSVRTVAAFGGEEKECARYDNKLKEARLIGAKKGAAIGINFGLQYAVIFLMYATSFWFGSYLIQEGYANGGKILTTFFSIYIGGFGLGQAGPNLEAILIASGAGGVIFEVINKKSLINPFSNDGEKPEKFDGSVEFKDIYFTYPTRPDVQVMNGFNLTIEVGKTYALVGSSGCGKSTVIQLLQRFYDPDGGEVLVGGKDVRSLNVKWLRQHIGVVSQEPVLFDTTIGENILYGKEGATTEEVKDAAKNANAHDFISKLPDKYNTFVGEGGTQLSGGQKQRIAIARALIGDPKILLLDEATSALDTESESIVQQALDNARTGRTTIVVAHRLSTIQNADVIVSIEEGRVVETGNHLELMDEEGLYYELVTAQNLSFDTNLPEMTGRKYKLSSSASRRRSTVTEPVTPTLERHISLHKQMSQLTIKTQEESVSLEKKQEEWDKEIPEVPLMRLIKLNAPEWWIIILGILAVTVTGSLMPLFAPIFGQAVGVFTKPPNKVLNAVHPWAAIFVVMAGISLLAHFVKSLCFSISGENLTSRLRSLSFKAMLRQEMSWFDEERNSSSALTYQLADDAAKVQSATGSRLGTLLEIVFGLLTAIIISFVYSWPLTILILMMIPFIVLGDVLKTQALAGHSAINKKAMEIAGKIAVESISNIRTVASISLEENFYLQYSKSVHKPYRKAVLSSGVYGLTYGFSQAIVFFTYAVIIRFGAYQITRSDSNVLHTTYNHMFVVFFAVLVGSQVAGQAGAFAPSYAKARLSANRIFFLLDRKPLIDSYSEEGKKLESVVGEVSTNDLHFVYPSRPDVHVLQGLDITVKSGQTLALVGPSGCGKSTVVSLLEHFYEPISGNLTLDDTEISELNIRWLRSQIGLVSQEPVLFDRSIADNIRYGANFREVSFEEVTKAAKAANIHNFVESLPKGYKTNVGAKGTQLSGGQKQRIAIARALIRDPKILLLDEATSALDTESEKIVQKALDQAREGRTCIVIAHRLSTIYNSDCIVVISGGKAIEKGTHQELMDKKGVYYKLNYLQLAGVEDD